MEESLFRLVFLLEVQVALKEITMSDWQPPSQCPKCGSTDTRFVEPHYEMSIYECNVCGCRFEIDEG